MQWLLDSRGTRPWAFQTQPTTGGPGWRGADGCPRLCDVKNAHLPSTLRWELAGNALGREQTGWAAQPRSLLRPPPPTSTLPAVLILTPPHKL